MTREIYQTKAFKRDIRKMVKRAKNLEKLYTVIELLAEGARLPTKYRDHNLTGNWQGCRECHVEPDWLLIYEINDNSLLLERTGSHSDLF
jgi:mRNA interferase YafQ